MKDDIDSLLLIHLYCDLLAARECILRPKSFQMWQDRIFVGFGNYSQAAIVRNAFRKSYPGCDDLRRMKAKVGCILVP